MPYPSTITTYTNPNPSDKLNSPSHSGIETAQNTALTEMQTFIGTESSILGTLFYDIRSANSNGGGHVQTANKGGTGQIGYAKGDLLVGASSSILSKLAANTNNGYVLQTDSSQSTGVAWGVGTTKVYVTTTSIVTNATNETSILSVTLPGGNLSTNNAIHGKFYLRTVNGVNAINNFNLKFSYGGSAIQDTQTVQVNSSNTKDGYLDFLLLANGATNSQQLSFTYLANFSSDFTTAAPIYAKGNGTIGVDSTMDQIIGVTATMSNGQAGVTCTMVHGVIEKI